MILIFESIDPSQNPNVFSKAFIAALPYIRLYYAVFLIFLIPLFLIANLKRKKLSTTLVSSLSIVRHNCSSKFPFTLSKFAVTSKSPVHIGKL